MRKFTTAALILAVALLSFATAQPPSKQHLRAEAEIIELMLLRQKSVRDELKIDREGGKQIHEFTFKQQQAAQKVHELPEAQQKPKWEAMIKENDEFLAKHLNDRQRKRLEQIALQTAGLLCVTRPSIARELKLTDEQKQKAKQMQKAAHAKMDEALEVKDRAGQRQKLQELNRTTAEQLSKLLTDEQKAQWKQLAGAPFRGELQLETPDGK